MNKIYKVIWSKAKHTYVVTSEIAKSHGKAESTGKGLKKLAIVLLAVTALLGSGSYTYAADSTQVGAAELKALGKKYGVITGTNEAAKAINEAVQQVKANTTQIANNSSTLGTVQESMTALEKKVNDMGSTGASKTDLEAETTAREAADKALDSRTSDLEAKTEAITYDKDSKTAMVDGKLTAVEGITDGTTKDGQYVKMDNYVGQNLNALDTQVKSNADDIATVKGNTAGLSYDESTQTTKVTGNATVTGKTTMDSASVTNSLSVGHNANVGGAVNAGSLNSRGNLNVDGNALVKGTLTSQSTINGKEIVSQTNITAKNKVVGMQGVVDNTLTDGTYVTAGNTVGQNINALDDQVKTNAETANQLQHSLAAEATARENGDTAINNKLAQDKTDTALHVTKDGNLIVGTKENQTVKDVKIRGQLASGSVSTGNITSTGDVSVAGKVEAGAVYDDTTKTGNYVVQTNSVGANLSALDTQVKSNADAVTAEASAREAADKDLSDQIATKANAADVYTKTETDSKIDAAKKEANTYTYRKVAAEEAARKAADNELNERITNEANAIHETTNQLQNDLNTETQARQAADTELNERITNEANAIHDEIKAGDTALDNRITAVKESLQADASVQDGAVVKAGSTISKNVQDLDTALAKETAARIGADKAQDAVIAQVNQNMVDGFNTINTNMANGFTALNAADAAEKEARIGADKKLAEAVNSGLSLSNDNVLQKNTTTIDADGNVTTSKTDATEMVLNKGKELCTNNIYILID
jgi:hypothetical protein